MKYKLLISAFMLLFVSLGTRAQQAHKSKKPFAERVNSVSKDLGISKEKAFELLTVMAAINEKMSLAMKNTSVAPKERQEQLKQLAGEKQSRISAILTPEQQQKMMIIIKQRNSAQLERIRSEEEARRKALEAGKNNPGRQ
jgi:hypothetical protein